MKVCMLVEALPPAYSGAARQALELAKQLRKLGVEIFFAGAQVVRDSPPEDTIEGFRVYRVPFAVSGKWTKLRSFLGYCRVFWKRRRDFDVLHIHGPYYLTLAAAMFAKYLLRKKILLKLTSIAMDIPSAILRRAHPRLTWLLFRRADAIVCMSTAQLEDCRAHGLPEEKLHKIPNGVDTERFRPAKSQEERAALRAKLGLSPQHRYVLFIGAIEPDKGIELLIDTAAELTAKRPETVFLLVGADGTRPEEPAARKQFAQNMREKILRLGLQQHVRLQGPVSNPEDYYRAADVFVSSSRSEGFGTVLIEAMACALPCVALKIPGVTTDLIENGRTGIVLEQELPASFAAAIGELLSGNTTAHGLGAAARETALEKFAMERVARDYQNLYEKLAKKIFTDTQAPAET
jgi:glycosyltransferase involved in cell wall biosynthesis